MKKQYLILAFLISIIGFNAFQMPTSPTELIQKSYLNDMVVFENSLQKMKNETEKGPLPKLSGQVRIKALKSAFKEARLSYKKVAWLIGYLEPENEKNFNGPPLTKVDPVGFAEIDPLGFQPIEEIIFGDEVEEELPKLKQLITDLQFYAKRWTAQMTHQNLTDREVFEAFRTELIQLFALSLTGFDSPVAFHSLPEAVVAWTEMESNMGFYLKNVEKKDVLLKKTTENLLRSGKAYLLENQDFNTFDRLLFYKNYINPLYESIIKMQKTLGIEFYRLTDNLVRPWNDEATSIFDKNFVNARYYSSRKQKDFEEDTNRIALGKILFFDPILSLNGKRACATCHNPDKAFAESLPQSLDLAGKPMERNAPSLLYSALATNQFWDGHSRSVEEQMGHVATNPREMGRKIAELPAQLAESPEYVALFKKAFLDQPDALSISSIEKAMGAYIRSLPAFDSDFDAYMRGETTKIDPSVKRGFNLFMGKAKCGTCHFAPVFNGTVPPQYLDTEFEVLGIPNEKGSLDNDLGRYALLPAEKFRRAFKTVTVRNAALSAPYMHNGVHKSLAEVVSFYNKGGGKGMGFDVPRQTLPFDKLDLTKKEENDLVQFMKALTDKQLPKAPTRLPSFEDPSVSARKIGGDY
jgi:cytochrome c peroxidase